MQKILSAKIGSSWPIKIKFVTFDYFHHYPPPIRFGWEEKMVRCMYSSVRPEPGFSIGNRNQDQVSVSVSEPKFLLPKQNFLHILFLKFSSCFLCLILNISKVIHSYNEACVWIIKKKKKIENAKLVTNDMKFFAEPLI